MGALSALGVGACLTAGLVLVVLGLRRVPHREPPPRGAVGRLGRRWRALSPRQRVWVIVAVASGAVLGLATGWLAAMLLIPAAALLIPYLLSAPPNREVDVLAALDRWVRFLGPSIATGKSVRDAIIVTRSQAPPLLAQPVAQLVARIDVGWTTHDALLAMADELDSTDADGVLAALALAASRGGVGARIMLDALADNAQQRLRVLREIAAERAKPRAVVKQVVLITFVILALVGWLSPGYFAPYASPGGQALAVILALAYLGALAMLRRRTVARPPARFLKSG